MNDGREGASSPVHHPPPDMTERRSAQCTILTGRLVFLDCVNSTLVTTPRGSTRESPLSTQVPLSGVSTQSPL